MTGAEFSAVLTPDVDGVRRWIDAGPLSINIPMLVAPLLLVVLAHLLDREHTLAAIGLATSVQVIHLLQPDPAQGAAFAVGATLLLLLSVRRPSALELGSAAGLLALAIATFTREHRLEPIPEVEGIVGLARDAALPLGVLAVLSCVLLAAPFVRAASLGRRSRDRLVRAGSAATTSSPGSAWTSIAAAHCTATCSLVASRRKVAYWTSPSRPKTAWSKRSPPR